MPRDRVDEDEVGEADPTVGVFLQPCGRCGKAAIAGGDDGFRPDGREVEVDAGGTGAAVEGEGHRPGGGVRALQGVGDVEHLGVRTLGVLADLHHPGLGFVVRQLVRHRRHGNPDPGEGAEHQPRDLCRDNRFHSHGVQGSPSCFNRSATAASSCSSRPSSTASGLRRTMRSGTSSVFS